MPSRRERSAVATSSMRGRGSMQAREFGAAAHNDTAVRGNPGSGSFKSKKPLAVIATPDLDLWAQLGPMLESTCMLRHADSLASAATMLKARHAHDPRRGPAWSESRGLRADLRQPSQPGRHRDPRQRVRRCRRCTDARRRDPRAGRHAGRNRPDAARRQRRGPNLLDRRRAERGHGARRARARAVKKSPASRR